MAFENLSEKLNNVFKKLKGKGRLSEQDVKDAMREVRLALLEADQVGLRAEELAERTHLSRPAVSRHLRALRTAGAVALYRDGTRTYYYPNAAAPCWVELRALSGRICAVTENAAAEGYPHTEEET